MIITGGKRRSDINATYATDPSPRHVQLWLHVRGSAAFSGGALRLIALGLVARSAGGPTFCTLAISVYDSSRTRDQDP